ncbi:MAG: hypothetical protein OEV85_03695 [Candidatus Thorarchaeota archaeon]|nr:hypothetical protein [Candidatus Thorarchaeota archaeon]
MRTCASCGKANNPIRKYCVRCGKPLFTTKVDESIKTPVEATSRSEIDKSKSYPEPEVPAKPVSTTPSVTSGDQWVKPSEISRDRMRTSSSSRGKSEMEKAKEAFARAEKVGIQEEGGDIVETRMLRASEVRELMQDVSSQPQTPQHPIERAPSQTIQRATNTVHEKPLAVAPKSIPMQTFEEKERIPSTPAPIIASPQSRKEPPDSMVAPQSRSIPQERQTTMMERQPRKSPETLATTMPSTIEPANIAPLTVVQETPGQEMDAIMSCITNSEDLQDGKIKDFLTELRNLHREVQLVTANQIAISSQLDARVRESQNKAEVKRIQYESINEQMRLAKQEWDDAKGEYEKAENRRRREISTIEDKIKNIQKRIDKAEGGVKKRVGELNKVREKIAQLQKQDS